MKKYELYKIIIISSAPDRACLVNSEIVFLRSPSKHPNAIIGQKWSVTDQSEHPNFIVNAFSPY